MLPFPKVQHLCSTSILFQEWSHTYYLRPNPFLFNDATLRFSPSYCTPRRATNNVNSVRCYQFIIKLVLKPQRLHYFQNPYLFNSVGTLFVPSTSVLLFKWNAICRFCFSFRFIRNLFIIVILIALHPGLVFHFASHDSLLKLNFCFRKLKSA